MEKVCPWCDQPSDRGWLKNRTVKTWWILLKHSLTACMPLLTATSIGAGTRVLCNSVTSTIYIKTPIVVRHSERPP